MINLKTREVVALWKTEYRWIVLERKMVAENFNYVLQLERAS